MGEAIMVGMAEVKVTQSPSDVLIALGLGSCIGVCAYDPQIHVAGMAHVVLPDSAGCAPDSLKFADRAIPYLLERMAQAGANPLRIQVALVGGAQLFAFQGAGPRLEIGQRNTAAVKSVLEAHRLCMVAEDVGGTTGRTVHLFGDGRVRVKTIGKGERDLVRLGQSEPVLPVRVTASPAVSAPPPHSTFASLRASLSASGPDAARRSPGSV